MVLFKYLFMLILTVIAIPFSLLGSLYSDRLHPLKGAENYKELGTVIDYLIEDLDLFLSDPTKESFGVSVEASLVNGIILEQLKKINPNYDPTIETDDNNLKYIYFDVTEDIVGLEGVWVTFSGNKINIMGAVALNYDLSGYALNYNTNLNIGLEININNDAFTFKITELFIGNLPIHTMYKQSTGILNWVSNTFLGGMDISIEGLLEGVLAEVPFIGGLDFDASELSLTATRDDILSIVQGDNEGNAQMVDLINMLFDENLVDIEFNDQMTAQINLGLFRNSEEITKLNNNLIISSQAEFDSFISSKAASLLVSTTLSSSDNLILSLDEVTLNRILDFQLKKADSGEALLPITQDIIYTIGEAELKYRVSVDSPYIKLTGNNLADLSLAISLCKLSENGEELSTHVFQTVIKLSGSLTWNNSDLVLKMGNDFSIGDKEMSLLEIGNIFKSLTGNDFILNNDIVIEGFSDLFTSENVSFSNVLIKQGKIDLVFEVDATLQNTINNVKSALLGEDGVLNTIKNSEVLDSIKEEPVYEVIVETIDNIVSEGELPTDETIMSVQEAIGNLPDETQQEIFDEMIEELENSGISEEDLLAIIGSIAGGR